MKILSGFALWFLLVLVAPSLTHAQGPRNDNAARNHGWLTNYPEALKVARQTGKPIMLVFRCIP